MRMLNVIACVAAAAVGAFCLDTYIKSGESAYLYITICTVYFALSNLCDPKNYD